MVTKNIGSLWKSKGDNADIIATGELIDGARVMIMKNTNKTKPNSPDYSVVAIILEKQKKAAPSDQADEW